MSDVCVCWSLCCCDAQMLALRRSLWGYLLPPAGTVRGASTVPRLDRQPSVLAVGRALRSLLLSATVAAPRSPCCLLLCLCSFVSTVLVKITCHVASHGAQPRSPAMAALAGRSALLHYRQRCRSSSASTLVSVCCLAACSLVWVLIISLKNTPDHNHTHQSTRGHSHTQSHRDQGGGNVFGYYDSSS